MTLTSSAGSAAAPLAEHTVFSEATPGVEHAVVTAVATPPPVNWDVAAKLVMAAPKACCVDAKLSTARLAQMSSERG